MKMFDCRELSDVIARRKLRFLERYAQSADSSLAYNEHLVKDLSVSRHATPCRPSRLQTFESVRMCERVF